MFDVVDCRTKLPLVPVKTLPIAIFELTVTFPPTVELPETDKLPIIVLTFTAEIKSVPLQ